MEQFLAKIRMVGNSYAIIIPKNVITKCNLAENDITYFLISGDKNPCLEVQEPDIENDENVITKTENGKKDDKT
jgi:antitoxin component of MazEF toxin-antitoxin module